MTMRNGGDELLGMLETAKEKAALTAVTAAAGGILGFAIATFLVPFLAVYAWNGLTPEGWVDLSYLPTVAGMFVFHILIGWVRK